MTDLCSLCKRSPSPEGHDACIRNLPDTAFACCGHGDINKDPYVQKPDKTRLSGLAALEYFASCGMGPPARRVDLENTMSEDVFWSLLRLIKTSCTEPLPDAVQQVLHTEAHKRGYFSIDEAHQSQ